MSKLYTTHIVIGNKNNNHHYFCNMNLFKIIWSMRVNYSPMLSKINGPAHQNKATEVHYYNQTAHGNSA